MSLWERLRSYTKARIGLGHVGASLGTGHHLEILKAQALARDALWKPWAHQDLARELQNLELVTATLSSAVEDRRTYLARPDLGRILSDDAVRQLAGGKIFDHSVMDTRIVFCISDGLSAEAITQHIVPFLRFFIPSLQSETFFRGKKFPFVLLPFSRVAAADHVGDVLQCELSVMFVGERPGLSSHDSMGIYLTYNPRKGSHDGLRNCISNVRPPEGLSYDIASSQLLYLMRESLLRKISGVDLKMESEGNLLGENHTVKPLLG